MPTYYFADTQNSADIADDDDGLEFDTLKEACDEADRTLREIALSTSATTLWMSVADKDRNLVHRARLDVTKEADEDC